MSEGAACRVPWPLWPLYVVWRILTLLLHAVGRLICAALGLALMTAGVVVTMTVVGAPVGIPLAALGLLLLLRGVF